MREASPRLAIGRCRDAAAFCFCTMQEPPAGAVKARVEPRQGKHPQKEAKPSDTRCRGLGALSCSDFVEVNRIVWLKRSSRRVLHGQRVWDAAQQVLARQGALYIQRHCLQRLWWYHGALLANARHIMRMLCGIYRAPLLRQRRGCTPAYRYRGKLRGFQTVVCQTRQRSCRPGRS